MADSRSPGSNTREILTRLTEAEARRAPLGEIRALQASLEEARRIEDDPAPPDPEVIRKWLDFARERTFNVIFGGDRPATQEVITSLQNKLDAAESLVRGAELDPNAIFAQIQALTRVGGSAEDISRLERQHTAAVDRVIRSESALRFRPWDRWSRTLKLQTRATSPLLRQRLGALAESEMMRQGESINSTFISKAYASERDRDFANRVLLPILRRRLNREIFRISTAKRDSGTWRRAVDEAKRIGAPNALVAALERQLARQVEAEHQLAARLTGS